MAAVIQPARFADIGEVACPVVQKHGVAEPHGRHKQISITVIVDVSNICTHSRFWLTVCINCYTRNQRVFYKRAIALIHPKLVFHFIVGNKNI